jgi:ribokinase
MIEPASLIVVGSLNLDLVAEVARLPHRGETLLAVGHSRALGGKGANQAVSAARHGVGVAMIGCVGADAEGRRLTDALADEGIDVSCIRVRDDAATGAAHITVDPEGSNTIVVIAGANGMLTAADVHRELGRLPAPDVVLLQLEIPLDAVLEAITGTAARVVLNPAPARSLPSQLLREVDVLVPNVPELGALTGGDVPRTLEDITARARLLADGLAVVVTMGESGALVIDGDRASHVPAPRVDAVDTTGAGDAFCGSLAAGLAAGSPLLDATRDAVRVASRSTLRRGALEAIPTADEIAALQREQIRVR